jgi:prepilin-type processing-associated H-X9-DG protein
LDKNGDRMTGMGDWPIVADLLGTEAHVLTRHRDGVNVLYSDGSARWQPRSVFVWDEAGGRVDYLAQLKGLGAQNNPLLDKVWESLFERQ